MMKRFCVVMLCAVVLFSLSSIAFAQEIQGARPMFRALPPHGIANAEQNPAVALPQWTFSSGVTPAVIVGTDPSKTNTTTTIPVGIIPIKMVYNNGQNVFDPNTKYSPGNLTATQMVAQSLIFQSLVDYNQGGTDLGKTQYEDAYERGNFWGYGVDSNTNYHLVFAKPVIAPDQTLNVPASEGSVISNPWSGIPTGTADINWFDAQLQTIIHKYKQIQPNVLPIFLTYNVYLTEGGCCIGGYHSANGPAPNGQTYSYTTTIAQDGSVPVFSMDVSALSHELGEWIVDPFTTNTACGGLMEVGDPLENEPAFGTHPYTVNGFTFHPQDLVFMRYFGAPATTSVNDWWTFQNFPFTRVCQNGQ